MILYSSTNRNSAYDSLFLLTALCFSIHISIVHANAPNEMHQMRHYLGQNPVGHVMATSRLQRNTGANAGYDPKKRAIEHFNRLMENQGKDIRYEYPDESSSDETTSQNISQMRKIFTAEESIDENKADEVLVPAATPELGSFRNWIKVDPFLLFIGTVMILLAAVIIILNCFCHFGRHKTVPENAMLGANLIENPFQRLSHLTAL